MKKLYLLFALSLAGVFIFNSCNKDDDFEAKDWPIPQEVLDYFYFNQGSYWVFENDKTGDKDTLTVSSRRKYWINGSNGDKYEQADVYINSSLDGYTYHYYVMTQASAGCIRDAKNNRPCYSMLCSKYKSGNYVGESLNFVYPFQISYSGYAAAPSYNSTFTVEDSKDTLTLNSRKFFKILIFSIKKSVVNQKKDIKFYWAKDAGIIKKENITDSQTWNLIDYRIIK